MMSDLFPATLDYELTPELLKYYFIYVEETGVLYHRFGRRRWEVAGCRDGGGYHQVWLYGVYYPRARLIFLIEHGRWPVPTVDHINRIRDDDRIVNLREASHSEQLRNRAPFGAVPWRGVSKIGDGYMTRIRAAGPLRYLGYHDHPSVASFVYLSVLYGLGLMPLDDTFEL
jgi:hypothetical protein